MGGNTFGFYASSAVYLYNLVFVSQPNQDVLILLILETFDLGLWRHHLHRPNVPNYWLFPHRRHPKLNEIILFGWISNRDTFEANGWEGNIDFDAILIGLRGGDQKISDFAIDFIFSYFLILFSHGHILNVFLVGVDFAIFGYFDDVAILIEAEPFHFLLQYCGYEG